MAMRQHDAIRPKDRVDGRCSAKSNGQTNKIHLSIRFGGASGSRTLAPVSRPIAFRVLFALGTFVSAVAGGGSFGNGENLVLQRISDAPTGIDQLHIRNNQSSN